MFREPRRLAELPPFAEETIEVVRRSCAGLPSDRVELTREFYRQLFEMAPHARALFPEDMNPQSERLLKAILVAVNHLDRPEMVEAQLRQWGAVHRGSYGITNDLYVYVAHALVRALRKLNGGYLETTVASCWMAVYEWMAAVMIDGADAAEASQRQAQTNQMPVNQAARAAYREGHRPEPSGAGRASQSQQYEPQQYEPQYDQPHEPQYGQPYGAQQQYDDQQQYDAQQYDDRQHDDRQYDDRQYDAQQSGRSLPYESEYEGGLYGSEEPFGVAQPFVGQVGYDPGPEPATGQMWAQGVGYDGGRPQQWAEGVGYSGGGGARPEADDQYRTQPHQVVNGVFGAPPVIHPDSAPGTWRGTAT